MELHNPRGIACVFCCGHRSSLSVPVMAETHDSPQQDAVRSLAGLGEPVPCCGADMASFLALNQVLQLRIPLTKWEFRFGNGPRNIFQKCYSLQLQCANLRLAPKKGRRTLLSVPFVLPLRNSMRAPAAETKQAGPVPAPDARYLKTEVPKGNRAGEPVSAERPPVRRAQQGPVPCSRRTRSPGPC